MAGKYYFYPGTDYGLDPSHGLDPYLGKPIMPMETSGFALAIDPRTANQLQQLSNVLSTGAKSAEVQMTFPQVAEAIPTQHLKEINRLRKLVGAELTLHGPIVEPTGYSKQGWSEAEREQAERQMWDAVKKGHELNPDGNIIVTLHASAQLPELKERAWEKKEGVPGEVVKEVYLFDEFNGSAKQVKMEKNIFDKKEPDEEAIVDEKNKEIWDKNLYQLNFHVHNGRARLHEALEESKEKLSENEEMGEKIEKKGVLSTLYDISRTDEGKKYFSELKKDDPKTSMFIQRELDALNYTQANMNEAYNEMQELFSLAYKNAKKDKEKDEGYAKALSKMDSFIEKVQDAKEKKILGDPKKINEFSELIAEGSDLLLSIKTPKILRPFNDFAIDKASDTFSNVAFNSYKEFKDKAPIISIENPPAGGALSRAEDLNKLIASARDKFKKKAVKEFGMSENEAEEHAEKMIGATWDVGHINMIRKFGYPEKQIVEETKKIAGKVKHIHLSDNFGHEHTELPMGMGNVPLKGMLEAIGEKAKGAKKVIETGNWYEHFKTSPFRETLAAFGSPIYPMKAAPSWYQTSDVIGTYFSGYGMNPDIHHSIYGAGFANLPPELGGQMAGRSRASGAPMD